MACHDRILQRLATLERVAGAMETNPEEALAAAQSVVQFFDTNGVWHTQDEEESVFPRLVAVASTEDQAYLHELEEQHQSAEAVYTDLKSALKELSGAREPDVVARFRSLASTLCTLYREHIASENQHLIALGSRILTKQQVDEIAAEMKLRRGLGDE